MTTSERVAAGVAVALLLSGCVQHAFEIDVRDSAGNCYRVTRSYEGFQRIKMVSQSECRAIKASKIKAADR